MKLDPEEQIIAAAFEQAELTTPTSAVLRPG